MKDQIQYEKIETENKGPFKIWEVKFTGQQTSHKKSKHWHRSIEIVIPTENGTEAWIEGKVYHSHPNTMLLVNSRKIHEYTLIHPDVPYYGYVVQLRYDFLSQVIGNIDDYEFNEFYDLDSHPYLFELINNIIQMSRCSEPNARLKLYSLAYDLLYELTTHYCVSIENKKIHLPSKNTTRLIEILAYLDNHALETFNAMDVALQFHLSYGHLAKLFKSELGMSMKEYLNTVRVRNASFDLLTTDLPVIDIALQNGFANVKAFYKEFDKVYHMTPKEYRKENRPI